MSVYSRQLALSDEIIRSRRNRFALVRRAPTKLSKVYSLIEAALEPDWSQIEAAPGEHPTYKHVAESQ